MAILVDVHTHRETLAKAIYGALAIGALHLHRQIVLYVQLAASFVSSFLHLLLRHHHFSASPLWFALPGRLLNATYGTHKHTHTLFDTVVVFCCCDVRSAGVHFLTTLAKCVSVLVSTIFRSSPSATNSPESTIGPLQIFSLKTAMLCFVVCER